MNEEDKQRGENLLSGPLRLSESIYTNTLPPSITSYDMEDFEDGSSKKNEKTKWSPEEVKEE